MILAIKAAGTKTSPYINAYMKLRLRLVRMIVIVNGCWHGYNVEIAVAYIVKIGGTNEVMVMYSVAKQFIRHFQCGIMTLHKLVHTMLVHVETNSRILC